MSDPCIPNALDIPSVEKRYLIYKKKKNVYKLLKVYDIYLLCFIMAGLGSPVVPEVYI